MNSPLRVGLIGCGNISDIYYKNSTKQDVYEIVACADLILDKAEEKAKLYSLEKWMTTEDLVKDESIELVLNLTVPQAHAKVDLLAIENGKHVYSEKPLAINFEDGERILAVAEKNNVRVGCAPDTFLGGRLQTMRQLLDSGVIGNPVAGSVFMICHGHESWHPAPEFYYKAGGGPLYDMGPYYLTALISLFGSVKSVISHSKKTSNFRTVESEAQNGKEIEVDVDTHYSGSICFENGCLVTFIFSFDVWDSRLPRIEIYGTEGTMGIMDSDPLAGPNLFGGDISVHTRENSDWNLFPHKLPRRSNHSEWERIDSRFPHVDNSRGLGLIDMVMAIRNGVDARANGRLALHVLEIMNGIIESSNKERQVIMKTRCNKPTLLSGIPAL